ncbi:hypothetical protein ACFVS2_20745 [Brevibacillus sp. NPDC058079]|uniref:hypothetical protein n=1 Tax=Brevibacillus sp. NPDC058079 TaxID=3346330 RepID=UPI0036E789F7
MTKERYEKHIERIKEMAKKDGFTDEDLATMFLDGFFGRGKKTSSCRIMQLVTLAYYRGWMRGIKTVWEGQQPIVLKGIGNGSHSLDD